MGKERLTSQCVLGVGLGGKGETDITVCVLGLGLGGVGGWGPEDGTEESDIDKRRGTMSGLHFETDFF